MNRINTATGELITLTQIKRLLNQSIPKDTDLSAQGFPFVIDDPQPEVSATQTVALGAPYNDNGTWRRSWTVTPLPNTEIWAAQAQARKDREARKVLELPDSDDPGILKQKLNAALALLNVR